ncbi:carbohydrate kinase family protein [Agromyces sp. MMS24-JH15]|uniref:carbohydrate kinase family protein n=1 Tax=Agromyces sp. MMS24-JH15 TaxID=3243765 RepID=UPI003748EB7E
MPSPAERGGGVGREGRGGRTGPAGRADPAPPVLAVVGDLVEDVVVWASEPVRHGTDTAARVFRTRGGSGANVAALAATAGATAATPAAAGASASAGASVRFIGCVGADAAGDALVGALSSAGVDVRVQRRGTTGAVVLLIDPDGERTMFPDRGAAAELGPVDLAWLDGATRLHVPLYGFERDPMRASVLGVLSAARERGLAISIDASSTGLVSNLGVGAVRALLAEAAPAVLFANETEAALLGIDRGGPAAAELAATVVVKHGPEPTEVFERGERVLRVPVEPVADVRDLTGAGDAFAAGFLVAVLAGAGAEEAVRAGHAAAAAVIALPGSGDGLTVNHG